jgi:hypothetical protein
MAIDWTSIENALQAWLVAQAGLSATQVLWAKQGGAIQRQRPYATLRFSSINSVTWDDGGKLTTDLARPAGQEVAQTTASQKEMKLHVECFTSESVGGAQAFARLSAAQSSLLRETVRDALRAGGVVVVDTENVTDMGGVLGALFEGRAALEVQLRTADVVTDYFGYIATAPVASDLEP